MGNPESSYDILPNESFDIYIFDISQRFSLDPLGKIICADQQVLFVSRYFLILAKGPSPIEQKAKGWKEG